MIDVSTKEEFAKSSTEVAQTYWLFKHSST